MQLMKRMAKRILLIILCFLPLSARPSDASSTIPHKVLHSWWYSHSESIYRRVDIYLPAAYDTCSQLLPVVYLIHGINGYEGSWQDMGSAVDTLESLIAAGRCKPMILVMPDCNKWPFEERPVDHGNLWKCVFHYGRLSHEHEIEYAISDLMNSIDSLYHPSYCAIAGLSDGARMAANVANVRQQTVQAVGLFSPVLHKDQLPENPMQCYSVYVGKQDFFYTNGARFHKRMEHAGYPHQFIVWEGGHNWHMWRRCLADFLEQL